MTEGSPLLHTPDQIVDAGERISAETHKTRLERERLGHFVAIDVLTGEPYVAEFPEEALKSARQHAPTGIFHLIRIGSPGVYRVSRSVMACLRDSQGGTPTPDRPRCLRDTDTIRIPATRGSSSTGLP